METSDDVRAIAAALAIAESLALPAETAAVLQSSNKLSLRLMPCDVFARVARLGEIDAAFEIAIARQLGEAGCPAATLDGRAEPRPYELDGFEVTLWTFHESVGAAVAPSAYADALARLHAGMRELDVPTPHFTDRVAGAEALVTRPELTPRLAAADREMVAEALRRARLAIVDRGSAEQLLHGEPHPGNVLATANGPLFIDFETCCRGPVEFDLAHVPTAVSDRYPNIDHELLQDCRQLVLAMVAAWRWDASDQMPNGLSFGRSLLSALRGGPPWPTIDDVFDEVEAKHP